MKATDVAGKALLKLQSVLYFIVSVLIFSNLHLEWWLYPLFFLAPDLSFLGYLFNDKTGVIFYNIAHHFLTAAAIYGLGIYMGSIWLVFAATILLGHLAFDRLLGFGLRNLEEF